MILISQHLMLVFSSLCFGTGLRKTLCVNVCVLECVCLYICVCVRPRTSSPLMLQREASFARRTPDWQAHRTPTQPIHAHVCARLHMLLNTRELHTRWCRCTTTFKYIKHTQNPSVRAPAFNPPFWMIWLLLLLQWQSKSQTRGCAPKKTVRHECDTQPHTGGRSRGGRLVAITGPGDESHELRKKKIQISVGNGSSCL